MLNVKIPVVYRVVSMFSLPLSNKTYARKLLLISGGSQERSDSVTLVLLRVSRERKDSVGILNGLTDSQLTKETFSLGRTQRLGVFPYVM